jgi:hypothetical protein
MKVKETDEYMSVTFVGYRANRDIRRLTDEYTGLTEGHTCFHTGALILSPRTCYSNTLNRRHPNAQTYRSQTLPPPSCGRPTTGFAHRFD